MELLQAALAALDAGQRGQALALLLEAWRATRSVQLADALTRVGLEAARALPAIEGRTRKAFHEQWLDVANARRAVDVPRLLDGLRHPPYTRFRERLDRLSLFPDDPRIGWALAQFAEDLPVQSAIDRAGWRRVILLIGHIGDARCRRPIEHRLALPSSGTVIEDDTIRPLLLRTLAELPLVTEGEREPLVAKLDARVEALGRGPPPTDEQLAGPRAAAPADEAALLEIIYAAPDDDAPRLVYADWLLERDNPRGRFITMQFQSATGKVTGSHRKREEKLLRAHLREWLGPLEPVVLEETARFERGFLAEAATDFRTPKQLDDLGDHPAWSTLRVLHDAGPLLERCALPGLQETSVPVPPSIATRPRPFPRLHTLWLPFRGLTPDERRCVGEASALPALTTLRLHPRTGDDLTWLVGTPLGGRLKRLHLVEERLTLRAWWRLCAELPALEELKVGFSPAFRFAKDTSGWRLEISGITKPERVWDAVNRLGDAPPRVVLVPSSARSGVVHLVRARLTQLDVTIAPPPEE